MKFTGKNILITGASNGIGASIAKYFADLNLKVWINYNQSVDKANNVKSYILNHGGNAEILQFDASNEYEFKNGIQKIITQDGELSYLVNNAGITKDNLSISMPIEDFDKVLEVNTRSVFIGSKEALTHMARKKFGAVVNLSSIAGEIGNFGQTNYAASKGAILAMTKSFAKEAASRNIRFNTVTPGFIETEMTNKLSEVAKNEYLKSIPLKRFGKTKDVNATIAFLLCDEASYITGENIKINGGLHM